MSRSKSMVSPLARHFKLTKEQSLKSEKDQVEMSKISYVFTVGSLMYAMVYIRPNIAHTVGVVSQFFSNPEKEH